MVDSGTIEKDKQSFDSSSGDSQIQDFNPTYEDIEDQDEHDKLSQHLSRVMSTPQGIERIQTLARVLSTKTKQELEHFEVSKDNFDLRMLLNYLREQSTAQGIESAHAGLAFNELTCWGIDASAAYAPSVPEMLRGYLHAPANLFKKDSRKQRQIIQNFVGIIEPGEMVLALGKPGAGCSSLLKSCAGEIENFTKVEGQFSYDGLDQQEMMKKFKGMSIL
ncbi:unnamed protein product [Ambrosiozyma monospora]|uniref:Unnamed protein product n=1 Tax=Ambrosiozyma monospora TaxID=43982 RepID=A0ACB5SW84_AMBMO|nr:unnamed protein product [Ambrosiozyma monospora]